ncbi:MAG: aspartate ammonia-lyase, partial [Spirochaetaceae bacterium]|nr:aspartate ammonia-lyase [Spirochaetaceae bacterium]
MREERDFLGSVRIEDGALFGVHSARARESCALGFRLTHPALVRAIITVKRAASRAWAALEPADTADAAKFARIEQACALLLEDFDRYARHFVVDALSGGAGTPVHMNVNEVIANLALTLDGGQPGDYAAIHPLDDVNRAQSTNDVYPTALRIACIGILRELSQACAALVEALQKKETEYAGIQKLGRTELMDAVPIRLGEEFGAWAQALSRDRWRLYKIEERLRQVNIGGAAVGVMQAETGGERALLRNHQHLTLEALRELTGIGLAAAEYPMDITQNNDVFVEASGLLKALAVNLSKIAGDLRLMASGPAGGLGELFLAPLQAGSSIMPGKVNPVIPEMVIQCAIKVQANDMAISQAASRGE